MILLTLRDATILCWRRSEGLGLVQWFNGMRSSAMRGRWFISSIVAVCLTVGLTLSPVVAPAVVKDMNVAMTDMSDDMPCCPTEQKSKSCPDCPLIAICAIKTAKAGPASAAFIPLRHSIRMVHSVFDDVAADGVVRPPPDHPPRRLI